MSNVFDNMQFTDWEPKYKHRFVLSMTSTGIDSYLVKAASRPSLSSTRKEIDYINTKRYVAGKYNWDTIDITFQDPIVPSGAQQVNEWFRKHYDFATGVAGYKASYKENINLKLLGPDGTFVEEWVLHNSFLEAINWNDLDYSVDDLTDITVTVSYDWAQLKY